MCTYSCRGRGERVRAITLTLTLNPNPDRFAWESDRLELEGELNRYKAAFGEPQRVPGLMRPRRPPPPRAVRRSKHWTPPRFWAQLIAGDGDSDCTLDRRRRLEDEAVAAAGAALRAEARSAH